MLHIYERTKAADHAKELVADIKEMASKGILNEVAFSFTLVPEGNPPVDKMADFGPRYLQIRKLLGDVPFKVGILAQATIGHNYTLIHPHPFQPQISLDGTVNAGTVCPLDEGFHDEQPANNHNPNLYDTDRSILYCHIQHRHHPKTQSIYVYPTREQSLMNYYKDSSAVPHS